VGASGAAAPSAGAPGIGDDEDESLVERLREWVTPRKVVFGTIVLSSLFFFGIYYRANQRATTADRVRQVVKVLQIFEGENGGFPPDLQALEQRYGPIPEDFKKDAWGKELRYRPSQLREGSGMDGGGGPLFRACDLRSAGRDGDFDNADDIAWSGSASGR
jgi:hypothetical protein